MVGTCGHLGRGRRSHCLPVLGCQFCCALAWSGRRQSLGLSILRTPFLPVGRSTPQLLLPSTQALLQTPWSVYAVRASCALKLFLKILRFPERQFHANCESANKVQQVCAVQCPPHVTEIPAANGLVLGPGVSHLFFTFEVGLTAGIPISWSGLWGA